MVSDEKTAEIAPNTEVAPPSKLISLPLLTFLREVQQRQGLRHNDYKRYAQYCSRRLLRLRKSLDFVQGSRKKFTKKEVTPESLKKFDKFIYIPLMMTERDWALGMHFKFEQQTEHRKKFHTIRKFKKALARATTLETLSEETCDARTKLEIQVYKDWLCGTLCLQTQKWDEALEAFTSAKIVYEKLALILGEEERALYENKIEEIKRNIQYCAFGIGDASAKTILMNMPRGGDLDDLINQTLEEKAATLQDVEFMGRKMAVKHEKVRVFLLREQEFIEELSRTSTYEEKLAAYESLLMDCKDAVQVLNDDLIEDPNFRSRQLAKEGPVSSNHFLYTYLNFIKYNKVIERNTCMIESMKDVLEGRVPQSEGKKPVKHQHIVRMYDNIISNLNELRNLAGLEENSDHTSNIDKATAYNKGCRCFYIAQSFLSVKKWQEAMALFQKSVSYAKKVKSLPGHSDFFEKNSGELIKAVESKQFVAQANSILEKEKATGSQERPDDLKSLPLIKRMDNYYEDSNLTSGNPYLVEFPPQFEPIPCKPLFFDYTVDCLEFPSLDSKLNKSSSGGSGQKSGWFGGWLGGWSSKK